MRDECNRDDETTCSSSTPSVSRVRDLARRFETSTSISSSEVPQPVERKSTKRIGKYRLNENGQMFRCSAAPVHIGIVRKKSSLKQRRSQSAYDVNSLKKKSCLKKSCSSNLTLSCVDPPVSSSLVVDTQKQPPSPRPRGNKPDPPAKPARLHLSPRPEAEAPEAPVNIMITVPAKSPSISRPRCPPPAPPKPPSRERLQRIPSRLSTLNRPPPRIRREKSSDDDTYQHLSSVVSSVEPSPRIEMKTRGFDDKPRVPTIPPPRTPSAEYSDDSQCYEEIGTDAFVKLRDPQPSTSKAPYSTCTSTSPKTTTTIQNDDYNYVTNIYCGESKCTGLHTCVCSSCIARRRYSQHRSHPASVDDQMLSMSTNDHLSQSVHFATMTRPKKNRRPASSLELDKLFRFKSEIQLNFTKKMGQLRQKVGDRRPRSSKCCLSPEELNTDGIKMPNASNKDPDDDRYIYGDDWSSDEEEVFDDRRSSMYREIEEQLNKAFPSTMESDYDYGTVEDPPPAPVRPDDLPIDNLVLGETRVNMDDASPDYDYSRQYTSRLPIDPPLYQIYMMAEQEKLVDDAIILRDQEPASEVVLPEKEVKSRRESSVSSDSGRGADCSTSASALTSNTSMRRERLVAGSHFGSQRSLWCELPEVRSAGLLETLDEETKILQEAYFEVITSEASYLRSLNILITHFMASQVMLGSKSTSSVITNADRKHLFSNIFAVRDCSERLLCDLESRLEENLVLDDICDILVEHYENNFDVYVKYCSNQVYQDRTLRRLKNENPGFLSAVSKLEADRQCQGLDMRSFLMLPMQRITRYPLLMYAIIDRLSAESEKYKTASKALILANKVVRECNEGARRMERTEQLLEVDKRLIYKDPDLKRIPLVSNSRHLVKRGTLTQLVERRTKGLLQSRQKARSIHVFLFSDIIMMTKKKLNGTYVCKDYATRPYVDIEPIEPDNPRIPPGVISSLATRPHLFLCVLMRNARGKQTELLLNAESETDRERWLSAIRPPTSLNPEEKVYAEWDCPQCIAVHPYAQGQDDELELQVGDVINILRKMPDGWFYGERCRDNVGGWFPSSYIQQILNDHVRANNYRHRLRLIQAASGATRGTVGRGASPFMDRLRRMSNPRQYFNGTAIGL